MEVRGREIIEIRNIEKYRYLEIQDSWDEEARVIMTKEPRDMEDMKDRSIENLEGRVIDTMEAKTVETMELKTLNTMETRVIFLVTILLLYRDKLTEATLIKESI